METKLKEYITAFVALPLTIFSNISDENQAMIAYRGDLYLLASQCVGLVQAIIQNSNGNKQKPVSKDSCSINQNES